MLYDLFTICIQSGMSIGLHFTDDRNCEDFIVLPGLGVLKQLDQPSINNSGGASVAFFDDNSISRFQERCVSQFTDISEARAKKFINNVEDGKSGADNLSDLTGWIW